MQDVIKDKEGNNKFGYKINFSYMQAYDWEANNLASVDGSSKRIRHIMKLVDRHD